MDPDFEYEGMPNLVSSDSENDDIPGMHTTLSCVCEATKLFVN